MRKIVLVLLLLVIAACPLSVVRCVKADQAEELSEAFRRAADKVLPAAVKIISHLQTTEDRKAMELQIPALKTPFGKRHPGDSAGTGSIINPSNCDFFKLGSGLYDHLIIPFFSFL